MKLISFPAKPTLLTKVLTQTFPDLDGFAGPWIAGGAARCVAMGEELPAKADIDVFFRGLPSEFTEQALRVRRGVIERGVRVNHAETNRWGTETMLTEVPIQPHVKYLAKIQLISTHMSGTLGELLACFDYSCCQAATDGRTVWTTEAALFDMRARILRPNHPEGKLRVERFIKYLNRGFVPVDGLFERVALKTHKVTAPTGKMNCITLNERIENFGDY